MKVTVNGREMDLPEGLTVEGLIEHLGLAGRPVAVERNKKVVRREERAQIRLEEGDRVEIVTLVGGG